MKSLFGFLAFVTVLIVRLIALAVPPVVAPMVAAAVRAASPFGDQPLDVQVDVDALGLIRGFVREIHVSGTHLQRDGSTIASLDITVRALGIGDHAFQETLGGLEGVEIPTIDGATISIKTVALAGASAALTAEATLERAPAVAFVQHQFDAQGVAVTDLALSNGGVSFVIFGQRVEVPIGVQDGALVIPDLVGAGPLELLAPLPRDAWRLTGVTVTTSGMDIVASVEGSRILAAP